MENYEDIFEEGQWKRHRPFWAHQGRSFQQMGRGNVAPNILKALEEKPMHGYEIIQYFSRLSFGVWQPSPGSVYPLLQSLQDQGLVTSQEENGKRIYSLTNAGRKKAKSSADPASAWGNNSDNKRERGELIKNIFRTNMNQFAQAAKTITRHGTIEDLKKMGEIIDKITKELTDLASNLDK